MLRWCVLSVYFVVSKAWGDYTFVSLFGDYPFGDRHDCTAVELGDDAPFAPIDLPFFFPWYGEAHNRTWISPNGALHFDPQPPCCNSNGCMFLGGDCGFDKYYNNIAAFTTDLDPGVGGQIHYCVNRSRAIVYFDKISLFFARGYAGYGRNVTFTFYIEIVPTGRINVGYGIVTDPHSIPGWTNNNEQLPGDRILLLGLRPPQGYKSTQIANQAEWGVNTPGTYPPKSALQSGTRLVYFPFAPEACHSPEEGPVGTTVFIVMHLLGAELNASLWGNWQLFCRFGTLSAPIPAIYNRSTGFLQCVSPLIMGSVHLQIWTATEPIITQLPFRYSPTPPNASFNPCTRCTAHLARCWQDCNGDWEGAAVLDDCGMCVGGKTGRMAGESKDCKGICYGPFMDEFGACVCKTPLCSVATTRSQFGGISPLESAPPSQYLSFTFTPPVDSLPLLTWEPVPRELVEYSLPFNFSFYGMQTSSIRIGKRGALYGGLAAQCHPPFPANLTDNGTLSCPSNYSIFTGFVNEGITSDYNVTFAVASNVFVVRYACLDVPCPVEFTMYIRKDGRLLVELTSLSPLVEPSSSTGVVGPMSNASGVPDAENGNGTIRPSTEFLEPKRSGQGIGFCQMGTQFCLWPKWGPPAGGTLVRVSSAFLDCAASGVIQFDCSFGGKRSVATYNKTADTLDCMAPSGNDGETVIFQLLHRATGQPVLQSEQALVPPGYAFLNKSQARYLDFTHTLLLYSYLTMPQNLSEPLCDSCGHLNKEFCKQDCNGDWGGSAYLDDCGACQGGKVGNLPSVRDCLGLCYGSSRITEGQCACPGISPCFTGGGSQLKKTSVLHQQYVAHSTVVTLEEAQAQLLPSRLTLICSNTNLTRVVIPFTFWYWGVPIRELFISPLGAIFLTPALPQCPDLPVSEDFALTQWAPEGICGWNVIAGSLSRYSLSSATITYSVTHAGIHVIYEGLIPPGQSGSNPGAKHSFQVSIFANSDIVVWYSSLNPQALTGTKWLAGVSQSWGSSIPLMSAAYGQPQKRGVIGTEANARELALEQEEWRLNVSVPAGVFIRRPLLVSNTLLRYCPLTIEPCLWPSRGAVRGGLTVSIALSDKVSAVACLQAGRFKAECNFGGLIVPATFNATTKGITCESPPSKLQSSNAVLVSVLLDGVVLPSTVPMFFIYDSKDPLPDPRGQCECASLLPEKCPVDCSGVVLGTASLDSCGLCTGGKTGEQSNAVVDCEGICYGPFQTYDVAKVDGTRVLVCGCSPAEKLCTKRQRTDGPLRISATVNSLNRYRMPVLVVMVAAVGGLALLGLWRALARVKEWRRRRRVSAEEVLMEMSDAAVARSSVTEN